MKNPIKKFMNAWKERKFRVNLLMSLLLVVIWFSIAFRFTDKGFNAVLIATGLTFGGLLLCFIGITVFGSIVYAIAKHREQADSK